MAGRHRQRGFSLIELAVVLVIIGLLMGGGLWALETRSEQTRRSEQQRQFEAVRAALYGFAITQGRLPCPDVDYPPDGVGDPVDGVDGCDAEEGALPWVDLGVGRRDAWGFPLRYRVTAAFADDGDGDSGTADPTFGLGDQGDIELYTSDTEVGNSPDIAANAAAVVVSYGPQGNQVWTETAFVCPAAGVNGFSAGESRNCQSGDRRLVAAGYRPPNVDNGFDDMLVWLPYPVLSTRMVEAGMLPE